jgi:antitoxin VapB
MIYSIEIYHGRRVRRMDRAKVFWSGRSQAVRLPKEYRFDGDEVRIRRRGAAVILEPIPADWRWLDELAAAAGPLDSDFVDAVMERAEGQERRGLDELFR